MDKKPKKRSKGKVIVPTAILAVLAVLFGGRFGLNWGAGEGTNETSSNDLTTNSTASTQAVAKTNLVVEVREDKIIYDGNEVSLDEFRGVLQELDNSKYSWELRNNHAIKAPYDQVKALFAEYDVAFEETES